LLDAATGLAQPRAYLFRLKPQPEQFGYLAGQLGLIGAGPTHMLVTKPVCIQVYVSWSFLLACHTQNPTATEISKWAASIALSAFTPLKPNSAALSLSEYLRFSDPPQVLQHFSTPLLSKI